MPAGVGGCELDAMPVTLWQLLSNVFFWDLPQLKSLKRDPVCIWRKDSLHIIFG